MSRNEHQTRVDLINPVLHDLGWVDALIREEKTPGGTDIIDGKPVKRKGRTDYLLCIPVVDGKSPLAVAVLEAKVEDKLPSLGIQQAKSYKKRFNVPLVFSTNGNLYAEYADDTGLIKDSLPLTSFPSPEEIKQRFETLKGIHVSDDASRPLLMPYKGGEAARYYFQDAAIRAAMEKIATGEKKGPAVPGDRHRKDHHRHAIALQAGHGRTDETRPVSLRP